MTFPTYSLAADLGGSINEAQLHQQIVDAGPYTSTFEGVSVVGDDVEVQFDVAPDPANQAAIDLIISGYVFSPELLKASSPFLDYVEDAPMESTTSTTFQTRISKVFNIPRDGVYAITVNYIWNRDINNSDFEARVRENSIQLGQLHKAEPKDSAGEDPTGSDQRYTASRRFIRNLTAGAYTYDLQYRSETAGVRASVGDALILVTEFA